MTIGKRVYKDYRPGGAEEGVFPVVENLRVLEIGFGSGALLRALASRGNETHGVDASEKLVRDARESGFENIHHLDISEQSLPYTDDFFGAVYCYEVFEHLTNPHRLFFEIRRVLKPGGRLYFSTPAQEKSMGYGPERHSFVYPGLLEKHNLERFFMQMYFRVEKCVETGEGLLVGRGYELVNMKRPGLPDAVEVVAGDYSVAQLYHDILTPEQLTAETGREIRPYMELAEKMIRMKHWDGFSTVLDTLLGYYPGYLPMYLSLSRTLMDNGERETALAILQPLAGRPDLPPDVRGELSVLMARLQEGEDQAAGDK